jgi:ketol-acid reductoisomerase
MPPLRTYGTDDCPPRDSVRDKKVLVLGFGLQGEPTALCLRDSGARVTVALRHGSPAIPRVLAADLSVIDLADGVPEDIDTVFVLIPDTEQEAVLRQWILPTMHPGQLLIFAHGFVLIHADSPIPMPLGVDVAVLAPHGPGSALRDRYLDGDGLPAQIALYRDPSGTCWKRALAWGSALGYASGGMRPCSVKHEVDLDLFVEQALLCGGLVELCRATYIAAVEAGYDPVQTYNATFGEIGNTAMLLQNHGPVGMYKRISQMAMKGSLLNGASAIGPATDVAERLTPILAEIESGDLLTRLAHPKINAELARRLATLKSLPPL